VIVSINYSGRNDLVYLLTIESPVAQLQHLTITKALFAFRLSKNGAKAKRWKEWEGGGGGEGSEHLLVSLSVHPRTGS